MSTHVLTWTHIDECSTADQVADLLRKHGIRGIKNNKCDCPLAAATGSVDYVYEDYRVANDGTEDGSKVRIPLTAAEVAFLLEFDEGRIYDDLATE